MAYMSQEKKKALMPNIKAVLKKYNMKGTVSVKDNMSLVVRLTAGAIDFNLNYGYEQVNHYHIHSNYDGIAAQFLTELKAAMNDGNHDKSDPQIDYFCVGWYITINIGQYDKNYVYTPAV